MNKYKFIYICRIIDSIKIIQFTSVINIFFFETYILLTYVPKYLLLRGSIILDHFKVTKSLALVIY